MDGFHIADALLAADGRRERKGAPDTFDVDGYLALLRRLKQPDRIVYAPRFDRAIEDSIAAAIAVPAGVPLVITEGNYLLALARGPRGAGRAQRRADRRRTGTGRSGHRRRGSRAGRR